MPELKRLITKEGWDVDTRDPNQWTPLHAASSSGKHDIVKLLLSLNADIEAKEGSYASTPLHRAAGEGQLAVVILLLKNGASKEAQDAFGWTPLFWAAQSGKAKVVKLLLDDGANTMLLTNEPDEGLAAGSSVLHIIASVKETIKEEHRAERYLPSLHNADRVVHPAVAVAEALLLAGGRELLRLKDQVSDWHHPFVLRYLTLDLLLPAVGWQDCSRGVGDGRRSGGSSTPSTGYRRERRRSDLHCTTVAFMCVLLGLLMAAICYTAACACCVFLYDGCLSHAVSLPELPVSVPVPGILSPMLTSVLSSVPEMLFSLIRCRGRCVCSSSHLALPALHRAAPSSCTLCTIFPKTRAFSCPHCPLPTVHCHLFNAGPARQAG
jgi:hypothetical protein